jgi:hypothetical protein
VTESSIRAFQSRSLNDSRPDLGQNPVLYRHPEAQFCESLCFSWRDSGCNRVLGRVVDEGRAASARDGGSSAVHQAVKTATGAAARHCRSFRGPPHFLLHRLTSHVDLRLARPGTVAAPPHGECDLQHEWKRGLRRSRDRLGQLQGLRHDHCNGTIRSSGTTAPMTSGSPKSWRPSPFLRAHFGRRIQQWLQPAPVLLLRTSPSRRLHYRHNAHHCSHLSNEEAH